jgi:hypothetical protein
MATEAPDSDNTGYDTVERVDEYENGVRLHIRSKRGTGTRDEDKVGGELYADSIEELEANRAQLREQVIETLNELRNNQPDSNLLTVDEQTVLADLVQGLRDEHLDPTAEADTMVDEALDRLAIEG